MLPSIDTRIQNLIKAMQQVVMPAIHSDDKLAQEQAHLVIGHLHLLGIQWDKAWLFETASFSAMKSVASGLCSVASGGVKTTAATTALRDALTLALAAQPLTANAVAQQITHLGHAIDALILAISADADAATRSACSKLLLEYGEQQTHRERVWFAANNIDQDRAQLESIDEMLASELGSAITARHTA